METAAPADRLYDEASRSGTVSQPEAINRKLVTVSQELALFAVAGSCSNLVFTDASNARVVGVMALV